MALHEHDEAPSLRSLQEALWCQIARSRPLPTLEQSPLRTVVSDARASAAERLDIYASMFLHRLSDNLALDFPKVATMLGADAFRSLAESYLSECPSTHPSVRHVGRHFPAFVRRAEARPWLADLAELEWARVDVFDRADEALLNISALQMAASDGFSNLRLQAIQASALLQQRFAVEAIWRAVHHQELVPVPAPRPVGSALLVWRKADLYVYHRPVEAEEASLLHRVTSGIDFGEMCRLLSELGSEEEAARRAVDLLSRWVTEGLLIQN